MIRKATHNDIPKMLEVVKSHNIDDESIERIKENFEAGFVQQKFMPTYFVYEIDNKILSFGGVVPVPINYRAYGFHSIWTHSEHQGNGYGSKIVNARIEHVKSQRREKEDDYVIFLSSLKPKFFEKFGFKSVDQFNVNGSQIMTLRV